MAIAIVHKAHGDPFATAGFVTSAFTATTGNLNVLVFGGYGLTHSVTSVIDNASNVYTSVGVSTGPQDGGNQYGYIYYCANPIAGATTVTVLITGQGNTGYAYQFYDISGASTTSPLDTANAVTAQTATTNPVGAAVTTSSDAVEIVLSTVITPSGVTTAVASPFTLDYSDSGNTGFGFASVTTSSTGLYSPSWTHGTSVTWGSVTAAFRPPVSAVTKHFLPILGVGM